MHLKIAHQSRIKQEVKRKLGQTGSNRKTLQQLNHSSVIGSIHTGRTSFDKSQAFFGDYKIRDQVREAKQYVNTLKQGDIMQIKQKPWNQSVIVPKKFSDFQKEQSHKSKLLKIKLGFFDSSPVKYKPNRIFQGTQTRDNYLGWNVSNYVEKTEKLKGLQNTNINAFDNTIKYNQHSLSEYKSLNSRYKQTVRRQKQQLANNSGFIEDLKQSFMFSYPNASPEKANACTLKMFDEVQRKNMKLSFKDQADTQDSFGSSFKAKLSPTQKLKIKYIDFHTGKWQIVKKRKQSVKQADSQGEQSDGFWSCCMNSNKNSKGCSYRVQDGNKMNLSSFNHA